MNKLSKRALVEHEFHMHTVESGQCNMITGGDPLQSTGITMNFNEPFKMHADASGALSGAVISQEGKPVAFFRHKLNKAQMNQTATEKRVASHCRNC